MFWRLFFLTFLSASMAFAQSEPRSMETESPQPGATLKTPQEEQPIKVEVGIGSRNLDPSRNELGIELSNMEKIEEISTLRRSKPWWLNLKPRTNWNQQLHADLSGDQDLRLRTVGEKNGVETRFEVGVSRDHRPIPIMQSSGNPFESIDDTRIEIAGKKESAFASLSVRSQKIQGLTDLDSKTENIFAGPTLTGEKSSREQSLGVAFTLPVGEITPFAQTRLVDFSSRLSPIYSNTTRQWRGGIRYKLKSGNLRFEPQVATENFDRSYSETDVAQFRRADLHLKGFSEGKIASVDVRTHLFLQALQTQQDGIRNDQTWDTGIELAQGSNLGWVGRVRSYAIAPTPSQLFGDGGILAASPDLPSAQGLRGAVGVWGKNSLWKWEVSLFSEQESHSPVPVAVSPIRARTIPIGGVWSRGLEFNSELKLASLTWLAKYSFQDALNTSEIDWQRGQRVPGRPAHLASVDFGRETNGWKQGLVYTYRSEDALDLSGLWKRPAQHDLGGYVGYGEKLWQVRLAAAHLLASANKLPSADFAGSAGTSLLEPTVEQTEVRLQCEFLL